MRGERRKVGENGGRWDKGAGDDRVKIARRFAVYRRNVLLMLIITLSFRLRYVVAVRSPGSVHARFHETLRVYTCMYVYIYIYIYIYDIYIYLFFIHISLQTGNGQTRGMRPENTEHTLTWSRNSDRTELSISFCFLSNNRMSLSSRIMVSFCVLYTVYVTQVKSKRKKKKKKRKKKKKKEKGAKLCEIIITIEGSFLFEFVLFYRTIKYPFLISVISYLYIWQKETLETQKKENPMRDVTYC